MGTHTDNEGNNVRFHIIARGERLVLKLMDMTL